MIYFIQKSCEVSKFSFQIFFIFLIFRAKIISEILIKMSFIQIKPIVDRPRWRFMVYEWRQNQPEIPRNRIQFSIFRNGAG